MTQSLVEEIHNLGFVHSTTQSNAKDQYEHSLDINADFTTQEIREQYDSLPKTGTDSPTLYTILKDKTQDNQEEMVSQLKSLVDEHEDCILADTFNLDVEHGPTMIADIIVL